MNKAKMGHASAPRFYRGMTAALALLLLCGSVVSCNGGSAGNGDETSAVTEETGMKGGDVFVMDGHLSEVVYPLKENMVNYATSLFTQIHDSYLADGDHKIAAAIVPDKNVYLTASAAYTDGKLADVPVMDYAAMTELFKNGTSAWAEFIDLTSTLSLSDYYYTDMHWKQESIGETAKAICAAFGLQLSFTADTNAFTAHPFVGSYTEKPLKSEVTTDTLQYLTSDLLNSVTVTDYVGGVPQGGVLYNTAITAEQKTYDLFISGPMPLQVLTSPNAATDRELIIFRDSFGSAIAPYFCEQYAKVTLVDLRYLGSGALADYIDFDDQDILFLYSTHILNSAMILK